MPSADHLGRIRRDGERILELARVDPHRPVPQYPGWTMLDLVEHTAAIHGRTVLICRKLPQERISAPRRPEGVDVLDWCVKTLDDMLSELEACDPENPVWGFSASPNLGFWVRRMVVETSIHRWDAELAFGEEAPLVPEVAVAGLDEFGEMWLPRLGDVPPLRVTATDLGRSWIYGVGVPVHYVESPASDLYLRLMSRPSPVVLPDSWAEAVDALEPPPKR